MCLVKHEDYEEMLLPPDVGVAVLVCLRSLFKLHVLRVRVSSNIKPA